jgi:hypothetical protein
MPNKIRMQISYSENPSGPSSYEEPLCFPGLWPCERKMDKIFSYRNGSSRSGNYVACTARNYLPGHPMSRAPSASAREEE